MESHGLNGICVRLSGDPEAGLIRDFSRPSCQDCQHVSRLIPEARMRCRVRRGVRFPARYLVLVAVIGIPSGGENLRDLEKFAILHQAVLFEALDRVLRQLPSESSFRSLFQQVDVAVTYYFAAASRPRPGMPLAKTTSGRCCGSCSASWISRLFSSRLTRSIPSARFSAAP
jgi:hypothetical protein